MAPNIATATRNDAAADALKIPLRNRRGGRIGSAARRSWSTNSPVATTPATKIPTIVAEPHGYCVPPQVSPSVSAPAPIVRSTAPSTSIRCERRSVELWSTAAITTSARIPTGRLT